MKAWTTYRRFKDWKERVGAMQCWCGKPSVWVSYCRGLAGRAVLCNDCHNENEK